MVKADVQLWAPEIGLPNDCFTHESGLTPLCPPRCSSGKEAVSDLHLFLCSLLGPALTSGTLNKLNTRSKGRTKMKTLSITILLMGMGLLPAAQALADGACSTRSMAGRWMFATGIGRQSLEGFPVGKDITAIGIFSVDRFGNATGSFDVTVQDTVFFPNVTFTGSLTVNRDCTGTLTFITSAGTARTDSIVVVSRREMLGMTQDPANLWTYQVRRISSNNHDDDSDSDSDSD